MKASTTLRHLSLLLSVALICACASKPTANGSLKKPDPATAATIHLYHVASGTSGALWNVFVYLNGHRVGRISTSETFELAVAPGQYELAVIPEMKFSGLTGEYSHRLHVDAKPQADVYARYSISVSGVRVIGAAVSANYGVGLSLVTKTEWDGGQ